MYVLVVWITSLKVRGTNSLGTWGKGYTHDGHDVLVLPRVTPVYLVRVKGAVPALAGGRIRMKSFTNIDRYTDGYRI